MGENLQPELEQKASLGTWGGKLRNVSLNGFITLKKDEQIRVKIRSPDDITVYLMNINLQKV